LIRYCFWNVVDPTRKLSEFRDYYMEHRVHRLLAATMPSHRAGPAARTAATLCRYSWKQYCRRFFRWASLPDY
jgi:hypothetical protein